MDFRTLVESAYLAEAFPHADLVADKLRRNGVPVAHREAMRERDQGWDEVRHHTHFTKWQKTDDHLEGNKAIQARVIFTAHDKEKLGRPLRSMRDESGDTHYTVRKEFSNHTSTKAVTFRHIDDAIRHAKKLHDSIKSFDTERVEGAYGANGKLREPVKGVKLEE